MNFDALTETLRLLENSRVADLEIESEDGSHLLRIRRSPKRAVPAAQPPGAEPETTPAAEPSLVRVEAGLVGRFYLSDDPVAAGQEVEEDEILGAIESMRLMNPVVSPVRGQIVGVFVEDGQPVEYGQTLYEIEPA